MIAKKCMRMASMPPHLAQTVLIAQARTAYERALKRTTSEVANSDDWAQIAIYDSSYEDNQESLREVYAQTG